MSHYVKRLSGRGLVGRRLRRVPGLGQRGATRMLASVDRLQRDARAGGSEPCAPRVSAPVFRAAYRELCTRLWLELEWLAQAAAGPRGPAAGAAGDAAILRLELIVLLDSGRSARWRTMFAASHCDRLCSLLTDLLAALYVEPEDLGRGIDDAKERLEDELQAVPRAARAARGTGCTCRPGRAEERAVAELVSLVAAQRAPPALRRAS